MSLKKSFSLQFSQVISFNSLTFFLAFKRRVGKYDWFSFCIPLLTIFSQGVLNTRVQRSSILFHWTVMLVIAHVPQGLSLSFHYLKNFAVHMDYLHPFSLSSLLTRFLYYQGVVIQLAKTVHFPVFLKAKYGHAIT